MPAKKLARVVTRDLVQRCQKLILNAANEYDTTPQLILGHIRNIKADAARKHVMRQMITDLGMTRYQAAAAFRRSPRRATKSALGI